MERTDHGEHATPRRVVTPGPNIASVDLVRSLHMILEMYQFTVNPETCKRRLRMV